MENCRSFLGEVSWLIPSQVADTLTQRWLALSRYKVSKGGVVSQPGETVGGIVAAGSAWVGGTR